MEPKTIDEKLDLLLERTAVLSNQMTTLVGNGQPGRIDKVENAVDVLEGQANRTRGFLGALAIFAPILGAALSWLARKLGL